MKWLKKLFGQAEKADTDQVKAQPTATENTSQDNHEVLLPDAWTMPLSGEIIPLNKIPDQGFAEGMMGVGFAIEGTSTTVCSPINGEVSAAFPGGHAIGLTADNGCELLIHIGIDSVNLKGEGFSLKVSEGDKLRIGQPLVEVDFPLLKQRLPSSAVIIVFPNIDYGHIEINEKKLIWREEA